MGGYRWRRKWFVCAPSPELTFRLLRVRLAVAAGDLIQLRYEAE
jgi:hypothetical protein